MNFIIFFIFGAIVGSFLIRRYKDKIFAALDKILAAIKNILAAIKNLPTTIKNIPVPEYWRIEVLLIMFGMSVFSVGISVARHIIYLIILNSILSIYWFYLIRKKVNNPDS